jgi:hypothetical protein
MKTNTDISLVILVLVVIGAIAWSIVSSSQASMAAAQVTAEAAGEQMPMMAVIGGQVTGWAIKTIIGVVVVAIATGLVAWARQWWKGRNGKQAWRKGPNAKWQQQEQAPRQATMESVIQTMLLRDLMAQRGQKNQPAPMPIDDELHIDF